MLRAVRLKFLFLFILTVIAIIFVLPSVTGILPPWWEKHISRGLNLGLDLKGGMHLILQVDMDQAANNALSRSAMDLKEIAEKRGLDLKLGDVAKQVLPLTLANKGWYIFPRVVTRLNTERVVQPVPLKKPIRVISEKAAADVVRMMVGGVENGEVRYYKPKGFLIAGKTGTAQVPIAGRTKPDGTLLRLSDVANVVWDTWPLVGDAVINGGEGLMLIVEKLPWANTLALKACSAQSSPSAQLGT